MMEYLMLHVKTFDSSWVLSSSILKNCSILFLRLLFNYIIFPSLSFLQLFPCTFFLSSKFMISFYIIVGFASLCFLCFNFVINSTTGWGIFFGLILGKMSFHMI